MYGFLRATFNGQKLQGLFINTALGNFAGYVAGSLVTLVSTHPAVQGGAMSNLFGVLPRKKIVVHVLPQWIEWLLVDGPWQRGRVVVIGDAVHACPPLIAGVGVGGTFEQAARLSKKALFRELGARRPARERLAFGAER